MRPFGKVLVLTLTLLLLQQANAISNCPNLRYKLYKCSCGVTVNVGYCQGIDGFGCQQATDIIDCGSSCGVISAGPGGCSVVRPKLPLTSAELGTRAMAPAFLPMDNPKIRACGGGNSLVDWLKTHAA